MQIIKSSEEVKKGGCITIGSFDGIHKAHQGIIREVMRIARERKRPSIVVSFWPLPQMVVHRDFSFFLTTFEEKEFLLQKLGVDFIYLIEFTKDLKQIQAEGFFKSYIFLSLEPSVVVVGPGHRFGRDRKGDTELLKRLSESLGFELIVAPSYKFEDTPISSTRIREQLLLGNIERANQLLGWNYYFSAKVIKGEHRGRRLGFPTINLLPLDREKLLPADGVYVVKVSLEGEVYEGVMYMGYKPTFGGEKRSLEIYLLEIKKDLYSVALKVEFLERLRGDVKFKDASSLIKQIKRDIRRARETLSSVTSPN